MSAEFSVLERVQKVVAAVLRVPAGSVPPAAVLSDIAPLDSLSLAEIASALDEEFATRLPSDELAVVQTVTELARLVERSPRR